MPDTSLPHLVRDLMTIGVVTCNPQTTISELAQLFLEQDIEEVIALDKGQALGVIGQEELVATFTLDNPQSLSAIEIMREGVPQVPPDIQLKAAAQIMCDKGLRALYLMHHTGGIEYPAAVITFTHYLRYLAAKDPQDLRDLGINAVRMPPLETFIQNRDLNLKKNIRIKG